MKHVDKKRRILFVDDDSCILEGFRRMLRTMRKEWDMFFADNAVAALDMMRADRYDVVVSDMQMPGMDGATFLAEVAESYPGTIRFVHSGDSGKDIIFRTVGTAHQYMAKSANVDAVRVAISRAFALGQVLGSEELRRIVTETKALPTLPTIYSELVKELQSPDSSMEKAGRIIEKDVSMSAKVLQLVNSAFFGLPQHVSNPAQAASLLGLEIIKGLILMLHVFKELGEVNVEGFSLDAVWRHSIGVGRCSQAIMLCEKREPVDVDNAFMAGLVHDLGKVVVATRLPKKLEEIQKLATSECVDFVDAEKQVLGTTHAEIGGYLVGLWGFPDAVIESVMFHHRVDECPEKRFNGTVAVHVANAIEHSFSGDKCIEDLVDMEYLERLKVKDRVEVWREKCEKSVLNDEALDD